MPIGVLALQGDFREHIAAFASIDANAIAVRTIDELEACSALVIPGGESTVIQRLAENYGLFNPIKTKIKGGLPVFGTCAGMIMLAEEILDGIPGQRGFGGLDVAVRRNAFGNQLESFEADLKFSGISGGDVHAAFIRAPIVERVGAGVEVVSVLADGRVVAVRSANLLGIAFHPEITGETRIHRYFVEMIKENHSSNPE
jgi:5'-phosphate synthase pdxT subunit